MFMSENNQRPPSGSDFDIRTRLRSFVYAGRGLRLLTKQEHNAWLHLAASLAVIVVGGVLRLSAGDWCWLVIAMAIVWMAEAFNTAIEELCDHVTPEFDPAIGRIKDLAAGGVLVASSAAAAIGVLTLGPPLLKWLGFIG